MPCHIRRALCAARKRGLRGPFRQTPGVDRRDVLRKRARAPFGSLAPLVRHFPRQSGGRKRVLARAQKGSGCTCGDTSEMGIGESLFKGRCAENRSLRQTTRLVLRNDVLRAGDAAILQRLACVRFAASFAGQKCFRSKSLRANPHLVERRACQPDRLGRAARRSGMRRNSACIGFS